MTNSPYWERRRKEREEYVENEKNKIKNEIEDEQDK